MNTEKTKKAKLISKADWDAVTVILQVRNENVHVRPFPKPISFEDAKSPYHVIKSK